jgi:hypothetical protein
MDITTRHVAAFVMVLAGAALAGIGMFAAVSQQLTVREALAGFALIVVAAGAALWLRLHGRQS